MTRYTDRHHAGRVLADALASRYAGPDLAILALPRGGVPVGFEVAMRLGAPLDVFVVRKLGMPGQEELAIGAGASGGVRVLNASLVERLRIPRAVIDSVVVGVPIAAPSTCEELAPEVDDIVCAGTPEPFLSVGRWYEDFPQTRDDEV